MNARTVLTAALDHRQPPAVPVDFGATPVSGMHVSCVAALRQHYGLESRPVKVVEPYQMLGEVDTELRQVLGIDCVGVPPRNTMFGFPNENWREWRAPWGQDVLVSEHFRTTTAPNGDTLIFPQGDTNSPPSGRLPVGGYFFDTIIRQQPDAPETARPADNLEEFGSLPDAELDYLRRETSAAAATGLAVVGIVPGAALGDIALVPAPFAAHPRGIRDVAEWYITTATRPDFVREVFARQTEIALANLERLHAAVGNDWDVAMICGTDFGTQNSTFCSGTTFDDLYAPFYRQVNGWIHKHTAWKTFKHSCGAVYPFIDRFIDCGFDILNPVQCSATGMEPARLKAEFGDRIVFWGGGIDTQRVLPFGTPAEVREQVRRRCEIFGAGGGFVFNSIHNVQAGTPIANLAALFATLHDLNGTT